MSADDQIEVALRLVETLERLDIPYLIGGSVASTVHGEPRGTYDVDFAVHLEPEEVEGLAGALVDDFMVDREGLAEAALRKIHTNLIHLATMVKVDLYVRPRSGHHAEEIRRARRVRLRESPEAFGRVATPEDTVLAKLAWYEAGGGVSDRQWRDVLGVLKALGRGIDLGYLRRWADELGLVAHLERALDESGLAAE